MVSDLFFDKKCYISEVSQFGTLFGLGVCFAPCNVSTKSVIFKSFCDECETFSDIIADSEVWERGEGVAALTQRNM